MERSWSNIYPVKRILMGPGPSEVDPRVLRAMATPLMGHLDPCFLEIMNNLMELLRSLMETENQLSIPISGTGSAGMETILVNLIQGGDRVLVGVNGLFAERLLEIAHRCGAETFSLKAPWGQIIDPTDLKGAIKKHNPHLVLLVHAETSTGVRQPLEGVGDLVREAGALLGVDAVTSLGGIPVKMDEWQIDALYSGTQKCISAPPGLAPISLNKRAEQVLLARKTKVLSWYLDLTMIRDYWGGERFYHHTAPISMIYALWEALKIIHEEGLEERYNRHLLHSKALMEGLKAMGIEGFANEAYRLPMLNAVKIPPGVDDVAIRQGLLNQYNLEIGGGLGATKGKIWRIGLMGSSCSKTHVITLLGALEDLLYQEGYQLKESGIQAAIETYEREMKG